MSDCTTNLVDRLATPAETGLDAAYLVPLLRLLATGDPVDVVSLVSTAGRSVEDTRTALARVPDTEYDDQGRIVGQGLTLRPTAHRFNLDSQELYTWCAMDTLIFPLLLDQEARVESVSPIGGRPVTLTVGPSGVRDVEPATAAVSLIDPVDMTEIRSSFCNQVHFFGSADDADSWVEKNPGGEILPIAEAFEFGVRLTAVFLGASSPHDAAGTGATRGAARYRRRRGRA